MLIPRKYQDTVIKQGVQSNLLISLQMGLGKSLIGIEVAKVLFQTHNAAALICAPLGIKPQWSMMILEQDPTARIFIPTKEPFDLLQLIDASDYTIIHYELLTKHIETLVKYPFSTFILDECHRIKSRKALRTIAVKKIKAVRKLGLSGTPFDKDPSELQSILNWLDKKTFSSYWKFFEQHVNFDVDFLGYKKNLRVKDPQALAAVLQPHAIFMKKADVMPELPPLQVMHIPIELGVTQRRAYEAIKNVKDLEVQFDDLSEPMFIQHALTKLVRLLQCASDPAGLDLVIIPSAKLDWLADWVSDNPNEPVLIFSRYRKTAERAAKLIGADRLIMGGKSLETPHVKPRPLVECRRIVATIAAAGEGYDLGHMSTAIFLDQDWSSILMAQAQERIDRGGNTEPKQIIMLHALNTVDELVKNALECKWNTKQIIDAFLMEQTHALPSTIQ